MISSMRMTSESSNLLLLIDNALNHALVLEKQLEVLSERLKIAELEASITLAQLHQVQEKVEYSLLLSQQQAQMLEKSANLQERTAVLLANSNR